MPRNRANVSIANRNRKQIGNISSSISESLYLPIVFPATSQAHRLPASSGGGGGGAIPATGNVVWWLKNYWWQMVMGGGYVLLGIINHRLSLAG